MADHIIDVISISPATGFVYSGDGASIACFALVSATNTDHPGLAPSRQIIALGEHDIGTDLIGTEISERMLSVECRA